MNKFLETLKNLNAEDLCREGAEYLYGFGDVDKDYEKAMMCFIKALELGSVKVIEEIGSMFEYGYSIERNMLEAVKWYSEERILATPSQ